MIEVRVPRRRETALRDRGEAALECKPTHFLSAILPARAPANSDSGARQNEPVTYARAGSRRQSSEPGKRVSIHVYVNFWAVLTKNLPARRAFRMQTQTVVAE